MVGRTDNDNGKQFHITLGAYDRNALKFFRDRQGDLSASAAIRACIRAAAMKLGFPPPGTQEE